MEGTLKTSPATKAVVWRDQYSVGIASIDAEHQELIGLINDLHAAMLDGHGRAVMGQILDGLAAYTVSHFANEEKLMQMHRFPGFERHKLEHDKLIEKVKVLQQDYRSGAATISLDVMTFLQRWLVEHIVGVDKKYGAHLRAAGVK
ncbi:MAG: bacteriohemerythrin [Bryobacteraceae bacterium]|jgi:hemerythrin-like metal-binding protein